MVILYISFIVISIVLLRDFKKGVLLYAPWKLFFNMNVRISSVMTFDLMVNLMIIVLFFCNRKKIKFSGFPLAKAFWIYGVGYSLTCIIPQPIINFIPRVVLSILLFCYIYYYCLDSMKNIRMAILGYAIFAFVMCGNGLLQPLMGINPLDDYIRSVSLEDISIFSDNSFLRMGHERYRSFIPHSISYGVACCVIFYLMFWAISIKKICSKVILVGAILMLLSGIIMCGSRSPILGLLPMVCFFLSPGYIPGKYKKYILMSLIVFLFLAGDYLIYSLQSIFDAKVAQDAEGSNIDMRMTQLTISFYFFSKNPIFGNEIDFNAYNYNSDIAGAESVWFPLLMQGGLVGVVTYALLYYYAFKIFKRNDGKIFLWIFTFGWLIMRSATSLLGVSDVQFFTIIFIIYRYYELNRQQIQTINHNSCL